MGVVKLYKSLDFNGGLLMLYYSNHDWLFRSRSAI